MMSILGFSLSLCMYSKECQLHERSIAGTPERRALQKEPAIKYANQDVCETSSPLVHCDVLQGRLQPAGHREVPALQDFGHSDHGPNGNSQG